MWGEPLSLVPSGLRSQGTEETRRQLAEESGDERDIRLERATGVLGCRQHRGIRLEAYPRPGVWVERRGRCRTGPESPQPPENKENPR